MTVLVLTGELAVQYGGMVSNSAERAREAVEGGPLAGLRVLELATLIAGPFAGRFLADFGAEVIKVEQPGVGDPLRSWGRTATSGESLWHLVQSRGKLSVTADLNDPADQEFVRRLAAQSDVLLENFRPGRLEEWNLDPRHLMAINPSLIVVRISGYGQSGPLRDQPGFGTIAEAVGGLRYITGEPDRPPTRTGLSLGDSIPSLQALIGLLIALHERHSSGQGQVVDVSLADSMVAMLEGILPEYGHLGAVRERTGGIAHNSGPTNTYQCGDGSVVCIAANTTGLFRRLFRSIGRPDLADDVALHSNQGRVRRGSELDEAIRSWTMERTADEVIASLRTDRVPVSRINSVAEICADPQFVAREMIIAVEDDRLERPLLVPGITPKLSRTPGNVTHLARPLGADNDAVRNRLGADSTGRSRSAGGARSTASRDGAS